MADRSLTRVQAANQRKLRKIRQRIDALDERLLRSLNQRAKLALEVGRIKDRQKWPVFDPKREAFVLQHVVGKNQGPLSTNAIRHIFQAILCECRRRQRKPRVPAKA